MDGASVCAECMREHHMAQRDPRRQLATLHTALGITAEDVQRDRRDRRQTTDVSDSGSCAAATAVAPTGATPAKAPTTNAGASTPTIATTPSKHSDGHVRASGGPATAKAPATNAGAPTTAAAAAPATHSDGHVRRTATAVTLRRTPSHSTGGRGRATTTLTNTVPVQSLLQQATQSTHNTHHMHAQLSIHTQTPIPPPHGARHAMVDGREQRAPTRDGGGGRARKKRRSGSERQYKQRRSKERDKYGGK